MIGRITKVVITVAILALAIWATVAAIYGAEGETISAHVRDYCAQYPLLAVASGVLIGHWFWPMGPARPR